APICLQLRHRIYRRMVRFVRRLQGRQHLLASFRATLRIFWRASFHYRSPAQAGRSRTLHLDHVDSQANYYTRVVLEFAKRHPDDPRVPEALSRAVKNTRMNCNNPRTPALSKAAYDLLHKRYPDTTWAKNTKYWF